MILDPNSVNYLRSDIEYNQLTKENVNNITPGANTALPTDLTLRPITRTTGNGIVYLEGVLDVTGHISSGDVIATLPAFQPGLKDYFIQIYEGTVPLVNPVVLQIVGTEIQSLPGISSGAVLTFNGAFYLTVQT